MAIKIDLEKAYDKIEWGFIREMLIHFNFPNNIIDLIMSCMTSVSTSLLFNGGCLESFLTSRGIHFLHGVLGPPNRGKMYSQAMAPRKSL